jgi:hypothetical protein
MLIKAIDTKAWIEIIRNGKGEHASYTVECSVDIGHGLFGGTNRLIHFINLDEFIKELDMFITDRTRVPKLNGTDDTQITFFRPEGRNCVMVSFTVGDAFSGYSTTVRYKTEGTFEVNSEFLNSFVEEFRNLLVNA